MFVDEASILVRGGKGGDGMVAFRREKYIPRGGPSGGDGGRGGSVYLLADPQRTTLGEFRRKRTFVAAGGAGGGSNNLHGKDGPDVVVPVPCGTIVTCGGAYLADLSTAGQRLLVARGGQGGLGNQHFATSVRQTPRFAQRGEPGEERRLALQLKLLADAGIVGAPNAGKSTLLAAVSAAHPKIADYPFTTVEPQLGVVQIDVDAHFVLVEVPGLIEGASEGAGLGHSFLRHVERTRVLVHLIDGALSGTAALEQFATIEKELAAWNPELAARQRIVAVSKQDLPSARAALDAVRRNLDSNAFGISAATGRGVRKLMSAVYNAVRQAREAGMAAAAVQAAEAVIRPPASIGGGAVIVRKEGRAFRVLSSRIERLAAMTDFESAEGREHFDRILFRSGARRKLQRLGIRPGDRLRIGNYEIRYS